MQLIIMGHGALRMSPQVLHAEIEQTNADISAIIQSANLPKFTLSIILPE